MAEDPKQGRSPISPKSFSVAISPELKSRAAKLLGMKLRDLGLQSALVGQGDIRVTPESTVSDLLGPYLEYPETMWLMARAQAKAEARGDSAEEQRLRKLQSDIGNADFAKELAEEQAPSDFTLPENIIGPLREGYEHFKAKRTLPEFLKTVERVSSGEPLKLSEHMHVISNLAMGVAAFRDLAENAQSVATYLQEKDPHAKLAEVALENIPDLIGTPEGSQVMEDIAAGKHRLQEEAKLMKNLNSELSQFYHAACADAKKGKITKIP